MGKIKVQENQKKYWGKQHMFNIHIFQRLTIPNFVTTSPDPRIDM